MAKSRQSKEAELQVLETGLCDAKAAVFADISGLKVKESEELRSQYRAAGVTLVMAKKTLVNRALATAGIAATVDQFAGGVGVAFGGADEVAPSKIMNDFAKTHPRVMLFGGLLEKSFLNKDQVVALASLPTKHQLLGQLVGTLQAPVSGFVRTLSGNLSGLVRTLAAVRDQKTV